MLFLREITPGQRLNARELAKKLGRSPTPIVQALKWLHFQGFLTHIPNRGYFLERITLDEMIDIYDLRLTIELANVNKVAALADRAALDRLEAPLEAHARALESQYPKRILLADMDFHLTLASLAGSAVGERLLSYLFEMLYLKYRADVLFTPPRHRYLSDHRLILEALRAGNKDEACRLLTEHITSVKEGAVESMRLKAEDEEAVLWPAAGAET